MRDHRVRKGGLDFAPLVFLIGIILICLGLVCVALAVREILNPASIKQPVQLKEGERRCPKCSEIIKESATVCVYCLKTVKPARPRRESVLF